MAGGLNAEFIKSPEAFLAKYIIFVGAHRFRASGVMNLDLRSIGASQVSLAPREAAGGTQLRAYFLKAIEDNTATVNQGDLDGVNYFFTDTLTGCQFLAYGSTATPILEHNNNKGGGGPDYAARKANATNVNGWHVSVSNGTDYADADIANVVGYKISGNWQFIMQSKAVAGAIATRKLTWTGQGTA